MNIAKVRDCQSSQHRVIGPPTAGLQALHLSANTRRVAMYLQDRVRDTVTHLAETGTATAREVITEELEIGKEEGRFAHQIADMDETAFPKTRISMRIK
ncbi:unnamed protein product [Dibothriocephalus latus]|uniref:Uncharacterized protein n=1 Tax=Dibothriocephalus latus TaxID=60516 RepID=A0A3P7LH57_DIBLA|nr:unnamed protein product [Dibothriocephalus latus]